MTSSNHNHNHNHNNKDFKRVNVCSYCKGHTHLIDPDSYPNDAYARRYNQELRITNYQERDGAGRTLGRFTQSSGSKQSSPNSSSSSRARAAPKPYKYVSTRTETDIEDSTDSDTDEDTEIEILEEEEE